MCGIVGYVGRREACPILIKGLHRLEYRGYDSAGVALVNDKGALNVYKCKGKVADLEHFLTGKDLSGTIGIAHTRWATHGVPNDANAHPHYSESERIALIHNGIIENYRVLKEALIENGFTFRSSTDSEVLVNLIEYVRKTNHCSLLEAVRQALRQVVGAYAIAVIEKGNPDEIIAARQSSPMVVGIGQGEYFLSSDAASIIEYTQDFVYVNDGEIAVINRNAPLKVLTLDNHDARIDIRKLQLSISQLEKGGYPHFMLKEIMEQPDVIRNTVRPRIKEGAIDLGLSHISAEDIRACDRIFIVACGSASYVGQVAKHYIERYTRIPVTVELASEFRYSNPIVTDRTIAIVISQSGETIDTLFALREAKKRGAHVLSIVNVVGSTIANESEDVIYTWAGPEIAVATTKAYSAQLSVCYLLALYMGHCRHMVSDGELKSCLNAIEELPGLMRGLLEKSDHIKYLASLHFSCRNIYFIGRNIDHALALEGSLKLKEISYIFSEAYPAGELKHGTISLIEPGSLVVALCTYSPLTEKMISNMREVKARGAVVLALATEGTPGVEETADQVMWIPKTDPFVLPSLAILPLQLFAYYVALLKGCDIDKPRNLAKSVTVE